MSRPRRSDGPQGRPTRTPMGQREILTVPEHLKEPGYKYRFFNTDENRIPAAEAAGWSIVENTQVGDPNVGQASQFGSVAGKPVGGGKNAVLMKIPSEYWAEDQAAKEARIKENVQGLLRDPQGNPLNQSNLYGEGISVKSNRPVIQED